MYRRFHERFGTAGVVLGVIALIAALGGTALAAGKLTGPQKKEVEKIAKKYAGKPGAPGAAGTNGTNGTNGKDGAEGKQGPEGKQGVAGTPGAPGTAGAAGKSVVVTPIDDTVEECEEQGGALVEEQGSGSPAEICNGEDGEKGDAGEKGDKGDPWTPNSTLPEGATETGVWAAQSSAAGVAYGPFSFPIKLGTPTAAMTVIFVPFLEPNATCTAVNINLPPAPPPHTLCVYEGEFTNTASFDYITDPTTAGEEAISKVGGMVRYTMSGAGFASGTFAVTN